MHIKRKLKSVQSAFVIKWKFFDMVYDVYGLESMDFLKETQTFKKYLVLLQSQKEYVPFISLTK